MLLRRFIARADQNSGDDYFGTLADQVASMRTIIFATFGPRGETQR
jgi:hypothetical protein